MLGTGRNIEKSGKIVGSRSFEVEKDYRKCQMRLQDWVLCLGKALLISVAVAWLFYRSIWGMLIFLLAGPFFYGTYKKQAIKKQQQKLRYQFRECIRIVTASMYSGYSVERAFMEAEKELRQLLGEEADMCHEIYAINQQIKLNIPVENLLQNLAERSGVEEIFSFGQVFGYAKRNGSDFARILKETGERIGEKIELERELQTLVAAKQLEQKIMNAIPMGILLFVDLTSPGFLDMMYTSLFGKIMMSVCLIVYAIAYLLSEKIVDIKI